MMLELLKALSLSEVQYLIIEIKGKNKKFSKDECKVFVEKQTALLLKRTEKRLHGWFLNDLKEWELTVEWLRREVLSKVARARLKKAQLAFKEEKYKITYPNPADFSRELLRYKRGLADSKVEVENALAEYREEQLQKPVPEYTKEIIIIYASTEELPDVGKVIAVYADKAVLYENAQCEGELFSKKVELPLEIFKASNL